MKPTIGRIVHCKLPVDRIWPAMIVAIEGDTLHLTAFLKDAATIAVVTDEMAAGPDSAKEGEWWWPERIAG